MTKKYTIPFRVGLLVILLPVLFFFIGCTSGPYPTYSATTSDTTGTTSTTGGTTTTSSVTTPTLSSTSSGTFEDGVPAGLFGVYVTGGWLAYDSNGEGEYCDIPEASLWVQLDGNPSDWSPTNSGNPTPTDIPMYPVMPKDMVDEGDCPT